MGWLFGQKKVQPKVPFPEGKLAEGTLNFPGKSFQEKVILPEEVKAAVGLGKPISYPAQEYGVEEEDVRPVPSLMPVEEAGGPSFMRIENYQKILNELNSIKTTTAQMNWEVSAFNEEYHFARLKTAIKSMHDRLVSIDKTLFKNQGD